MGGGWHCVNLPQGPQQRTPVTQQMSGRVGDESDWQALGEAARGTRVQNVSSLVLLWAAGGPERPAQTTPGFPKSLGSVSGGRASLCLPSQEAALGQGQDSTRSHPQGDFQGTPGSLAVKSPMRHFERKTHISTLVSRPR